MQATVPEQSRTRCVLAHEPGVEPPHALMEALKRQGIATTVCDSPFVALARLCEAAGRHEGPVALLIHEPDRMSRSQALRDAAERFAPRAACWVYESGERPRLRAARAGSLPDDPRHERTGKVVLGGARRRRAAAKGKGEEPRLRLVEMDTPGGDRPPGGANTGGAVDEELMPGPASRPGRAGPSRPLLTDDEISMLMGDPTED